MAKLSIDVTNPTDPATLTPGTLRHAFQGVAGPRNIYIRTTEPIVLTRTAALKAQDNVRVYNMTKSHITGASIHVYQSEDIYLKNLRIRPEVGAPPGDSLSIQDSTRVTVSQCSLERSIDENASVRGNCGPIIFDKCILAECDISHSCGFLSWGSVEKLTMTNCILSSNHK